MYLGIRVVVSNGATKNQRRGNYLQNGCFYPFDINNNNKIKKWPYSIFAGECWGRNKGRRRCALNFDLDPNIVRPKLQEPTSYFIRFPPPFSWIQLTPVVELQPAPLKFYFLIPWWTPLTSSMSVRGLLERCPHGHRRSTVINVDSVSGIFPRLTGFLGRLYRSISRYRSYTTPPQHYITYNIHCLFTEIIDNVSNFQALYLYHEIGL